MNEVESNTNEGGEDEDLTNSEPPSVEPFLTQLKKICDPLMLGIQQKLEPVEEIKILLQTVQEVYRNTHYFRNDQPAHQYFYANFLPQCISNILALSSIRHQQVYIYIYIYIYSYW